MRLRRVCLFATLYLLCGPTGLSAQYRDSEHMHIEISPFGGSRFGGVVQLNPNPSNIDYFTIKSSWDYGVLGDVSLLPTLQAEFMWNRQPTELGAHNFFTGTTSQAGNATLDMYQFGFLYEFGSAARKTQTFRCRWAGIHALRHEWDIELRQPFLVQLRSRSKILFHSQFGLALGSPVFSLPDDIFKRSNLRPFLRSLLRWNSFKLRPAGTSQPWLDFSILMKLSSGLRRIRPESLAANRKALDKLDLRAPDV